MSPDAKKRPPQPRCGGHSLLFQFPGDGVGHDAPALGGAEHVQYSGAQGFLESLAVQEGVEQGRAAGSSLRLRRGCGLDLAALRRGADGGRPRNRRGPCRSSSPFWCGRRFRPAGRTGKRRKRRPFCPAALWWASGGPFQICRRFPWGSPGRRPGRCGSGPFPSAGDSMRCANVTMVLFLLSCSLHFSIPRLAANVTPAAQKV